MVLLYLGVHFIIKFSIESHEIGIKFYIGYNGAYICTLQMRKLLVHSSGKQSTHDNKQQGYSTKEGGGQWAFKITRSHRSRKVHNSCHLLVQGPESPLEVLKHCSGLRTISLRCRVWEIKRSLRVIMVLRTSADNVGIWITASVTSDIGESMILTIYWSRDGDRACRSGIDMAKCEREWLKSVRTAQLAISYSGRCREGIHTWNYSHRRGCYNVLVDSSREDRHGFADRSRILRD